MSSKACPNLRRGLRRVVLNDLDVGDMVSVGVEMISEPGPEEVLRACATAPASVASRNEWYQCLRATGGAAVLPVPATASASHSHNCCSSIPQALWFYATTVLAYDLNHHGSIPRVMRY